MSLDNLLETAAQLADSRNDEAVAGLVRRLAGNSDQDSVYRELQQTCEYAKSLRKLRKKLQSLGSIRERIDEIGIVRPRWSAILDREFFYESKINDYRIRLDGEDPCGRCASCVSRGLTPGTPVPDNPLSARFMGTRVVDHIRAAVTERSAGLREALNELLRGE